jgi:hypothetical protein
VQQVVEKNRNREVTVRHKAVAKVEEKLLEQKKMDLAELMQKALAGRRMPALRPGAFCS